MRGQPVRRFERKPGMRAEALDCLVYAMAARHIVTINPDRREEELGRLGDGLQLRNVIRSAWLDKSKHA